MIKRYVAVILVPDRYSPSWSPVVVGRFRTFGAAYRRIRSLAPETVTRYRTGRRLKAAEIRDDKRNESFEVDYPTEVVPSVGELGWTP